MLASRSLSPWTAPRSRAPRISGAWDIRAGGSMAHALKVYTAWRNPASAGDGCRFTSCQPFRLSHPRLPGKRAALPPLAPVLKHRCLRRIWYRGIKLHVRQRNDRPVRPANSDNRVYTSGECALKEGAVAVDQEEPIPIQDPKCSDDWPWGNPRRTPIVGCYRTVRDDDWSFSPVRLDIHSLPGALRRSSILPGEPHPRARGARKARVDRDLVVSSCRRNPLARSGAPR